jgi:MFS family permease
MSKIYNSHFLRMAAANFFIVVSFSHFFLFPLFIKERGGSEADIGVIMAAFLFSSILFRPWISDMVDRLGRKASYTMGCIIITVLPLAYLFLTGSVETFYYPLLGIRVIHGVGLALCFTAVFTFIVDIVPNERLNEGIGVFGITGLTGLAMGPVIAETILLHFGFPVYFISAAVAGAIGLIAQWPIPEPVNLETAPISIGFFKILFQVRRLWITLLSFLFGFGLSAFSNFISPLAEERQIAFISLFYIAYSCAAVGTRLLGGRLADRFGESKVIPPAFVLTASGFILLTLKSSEALLVISGLLCGSGHGFLFPSLNALAVKGEPPSVRGKITGIFTGGLDFGGFSGSLVLGAVGETFGYGTLFGVAGLALLLGFPLSWWAQFLKRG